MGTIKEVSQRAGVSIRTVSRVLNDNPNVASATRERVLGVIEELDFRPSAAARYMRTGQSQRFGFLTDELAQNAFSYDVIIGAQQRPGNTKSSYFFSTQAMIRKLRCEQST